MGNQNTTPETAPGAVPSMVCGIIAVVTFCLPLAPVVLGVLAIVFCVKATKRIKDSGETLGGKGMAIAGLVTGIVGLALGLIYQIVYIVSLIGGAMAMPFSNMFR
jgi:Domain of unknown function (DUF4190)